MNRKDWIEVNIYYPGKYTCRSVSFTCAPVFLENKLNTYNKNTGKQKFRKGKGQYGEEKGVTTYKR